MPYATWTIKSAIQHLIENTKLRNIISSPPDVFCIAAYLLEISGAYVKIVDPRFYRYFLEKTDCENTQEWQIKVEAVATKWKERHMDSSSIVEIEKYFRELKSLEECSIRDIISGPNSDQLTKLLLCLLAYADQACSGVGLQPSSEPTNPDQPSSLLWELDKRLLDGRRRPETTTLCDHINPFKAAVLPKMRTPQVGLTLRSLSHHLALIINSSVISRWNSVDISLPQDVQDQLRCLILPWPLHVSPRQFVPGNDRCSADGYGTFEFKPKPFYGHLPWLTTESKGESEQKGEWRNAIVGLVASAAGELGRVDCIVLPELALTPTEYDYLVQLLESNETLAQVGMLISGCRDSMGDRQTNEVRFWFRSLPAASRNAPTPKGESVTQQKHHRWKLDANQVMQYGIGSSLGVETTWWEGHLIEDRELSFWALRDWLSICAVICEDLARQDPVGQVIRSVGPNLVFALLADGPQLPVRWSARYATVLAEDPGSSVLALTSLGMANLSRPEHKLNPSNRVIGLWKDPSSGKAIELELPPGCLGLALSITREYRKEFSADGRSDGGLSGYVRLGGCFPLTLAH